jgi:competence protein ComEC
LNTTASGRAGLRLNDDQITDATNTVNDHPAVLTTTAFDTYDGTITSNRDTIDVQAVYADAQGDKYDNLNDECVVLENSGDGDLDLIGYPVTDEVDHQYALPDGFVLGVGHAWWPDAHTYARGRQEK